MARLPRLCLPGNPHHLIQRGNDRQTTFRDAQDFALFLELLGDYARAQHVAIHAYVLMSNHFHLLATPETADGLPKMMQAVGRRYVQRFNLRHTRTGTLWEGRYRATPIQTERYLLACMAYLDLNPVRAGMVLRPRDYPWSSHSHYAGLRADPLVTPHPLVWALGNTPFAREAAYRELVEQGISRPLREVLTESALRSWALGDEGFVSRVEQQAGRRAVKARAGRPHRQDH